MKTSMKFLTCFILFLGIMFFNQDALSFNVSLVSSIEVPLVCTDFSCQENATFTNMSSGDLWEFDIDIGSGNLVLNYANYSPMYPFVPEGGGVYMNLSSTAVVKVLIGINKYDRLPGRYRNIKFRYRHYNGWYWEGWKEKNVKIEVDDLEISGDEYVCTSNKTFSISPSMPSGYSGS